MLELIVAMGIGTLLLTQCSKPKQANNNTKSIRRSSEKPGQQVPMNKGEKAGGEEKQQSKKAKSKMNADGGGGEEQEVGEKERQKTKTNKSRLSNKKTTEAQGPSSTKPSKPMDGTQGNQTDAQKTSNAGFEYEKAISADHCWAMEATVYDFSNTVRNELAMLNKTTGDLTEVQFRGNIDTNILEQEAVNEEVYQQIAATWIKKSNKPVERRKGMTKTNGAAKAGEKVKPADRSITEESENTEESTGKQRVTVNNKKSLLYETKELFTEDDDREEEKTVPKREKKTLKRFIRR